MAKQSCDNNCATNFNPLLYLPSTLLCWWCVVLFYIDAISFKSALETKYCITAFDNILYHAEKPLSKDSAF